MAQTQIPTDPDRELERLYASITGRAPFSYAPSQDPLYRSYADRYVQNGRLAMRDTVGKSAALTGGYGSSYAETAGQQQYGEYLRALSDALPELYSRAFARYQAEGDALRDDYSLAWQRRENDYQRERDALGDERYAAEQAAEAERQRLKQREADYNRLYKLVASAGYEPTDEELEAVGLTRAQAEALRTEYLRANKLLPGSGKTVVYRSGRSKKKTEKTTTDAASNTDRILDTIVKPASGAAKSTVRVVKPSQAGKGGRVTK